MNKFLPIFTKLLISRLGINILGFIAVCTLVWFVGYIFDFSVKLRLLIIGIIIVLFVLVALARLLWLRYRGARLHKQLQTHGESSAGRQLEVELLKEKLTEAIASLKASELGVKYRGNAALYALPWYMIIGPSACGKSTLLRNSGLHFPLSSSADLQVKGFGGTRNCDWWLTDEAIILDTAGRYTTEETDKQEWLSFLELLRKYRPRKPINGIIVAVNLADLLTAKKEDINWHVKIIRERIEELHNRLGFVFPVTLLFTKCDLLKGFTEFFGDLSAIEREQVWGINFETDYNQQLDELYIKLTKLRLHKMSVERNLQRKITIFDFPEQFRASLDYIKQFIQLLLKENPYQETPIFCGAYFTSGTQEGTLIQRLIGDLQAAFSKTDDPEQDAKKTSALEKKSYFIKDLFSKVIFPNKDFAAKTRKRVRTQLWLKSASVVGCSGVFGVAFMLFSTSFTSNVLLLHNGEQIIKQVISDDSLDSLQNAYNYYQSLINYKNEIPLHLRLGLYRGNTQIQPLQDILSQILQYKFLQPMGKYLTQKLTKDSKIWQSADHTTHRKLRGDYYTKLKAYLMLCFPKQVDTEQATIIFSAYWSKILSGKTADAKQYAGMVRFYLQHPSAWNADEQLVTKVRQQLYLPDDTENLYAQINSIYGSSLEPILLHNLLKGHDTNLLFSNYQLPSIYTLKNWYQVIKPAIDKIASTASQGDWVINTPFNLLNRSDVKRTYQQKEILNSENKLRREITNLYFSDYKQVWLKLMASIQVRRFESLNDANEAIGILSGTEDPITQLLHVVTANTKINQLNDSFSGLRNITGDNIKSYLNELIKIQNDLQTLTASPNLGRDAQQYAARLLSGSGGDTELYRSMITANMLVNQLDDAQTRISVKQLLLQPIRETWRTILHTATYGLEQQWQAQIVSDYRQNIAHLFPFERYTNEDAAIADVEDFFQPKNGLLWSFINTYLRPFLLRTENGWQEQKWLGIGAGFSLQMLQALDEARLISNDLFGSGGNQPRFNYQIYPKPTHGLSQTIIAIDGQNYHYRNGPQEWHEFSWPGNSGNQDSYLSVVAVDGTNPETIQTSGIWGLFHLINKGRLTVEHDSTSKVVWLLKNNKHSYQVSILLHFNGRGNIFQKLLLKGFVLPKHLFAENISRMEGALSD